MANRFKSKDLEARGFAVRGSSEDLPEGYQDHRYDGFSDARNSFVPVWISLPPFLMLEYFVELSVPGIPSALVFPVGFLLFWAFYFTFYKPNVLEDRLAEPIRNEFIFPPNLILGFVLWFLQATLLEMRYWLFESYRSKARLESADTQEKFKRLVEGSPTQKQETKSQSKTQTAPLPNYSPEIQRALMVLGFQASAPIAWGDVHKRYRMLAKKLHPDLNDTGTQGRRFIEVDQAYRSLAKNKHLF